MGLGTALHKAAELDRVDAVRFLIRKGADTSIKDANGRTALDCAVMPCNWEIAELLESGMKD